MLNDTRNKFSSISTSLQSRRLFAYFSGALRRIGQIIKPIILTEDFDLQNAKNVSRSLVGELKQGTHLEGCTCTVSR